MVATCLWLLKLKYHLIGWIYLVIIQNIHKMTMIEDENRHILIGVESMDKFEPRTDKNKYNELVKNTHFVFIPYIFHTQQEDVIKFF